MQTPGGRIEMQDIICIPALFAHYITEQSKYKRQCALKKPKQSECFNKKELSAH
jgi:hypothetical protein